MKLELFDSSDFTMAIISDPQLGYSNKGDDGQPDVYYNSDTEANENHRDSIEALAATADINFAGVIINGDLVNTPNEDIQVDDYNRIYRDETSLNIYPGLGNHDYQNYTSDVSKSQRMVNEMIEVVESVPNSNFDRNYETMSLDDGSWQHSKGSLSYSWDIGNFHFVQLHNYPGYEVTLPEGIEEYEEMDWSIFDSWESFWSGDSWSAWYESGLSRLIDESTSFFIQSYDITSGIEWLDNDLQALKPGTNVILNYHRMFDSGGFNPNSTVTDSTSDDYDGYNEYQEFEAVLIDALNQDINIVAIFIGHLHKYAGQTNYNVWNPNPDSADKDSDHVLESGRGSGESAMSSMTSITIDGNKLDSGIEKTIQVYFGGAAMYHNYLQVHFTDAEVTVQVMHSCEGTAFEMGSTGFYTIPLP